MEGKKIKSFFDIFLNFDNKNQEMLKRVADNMSEISSLLILDSVDYFLGVINADEQSEDEDEDDVEEEDEEKEWWFISCIISVTNDVKNFDFCNSKMEETTHKIKITFIFFYARHFGFKKSKWNIH